MKQYMIEYWIDGAVKAHDRAYHWVTAKTAAHARASLPFHGGIIRVTVCPVPEYNEFTEVIHDAHYLPH